MSRKIASQWPGALLFLSGALKTGLSLEQALEVLTRETPEPLRSELSRRLNWRTGTESLETRISDLLQEPALALPRAALLLSHRSGGQAGRLLEIGAAQLQEKLEMSEKIKALSAQSIASAWIVGLSPFALLGIMQLFASDYVAPLFTTRAGALILLLVCVLVGTGLFLVRRMADVETE